MAAEVELDWAAVNRLLRGDAARQATHDAADDVRRRWEANIHPVTGMTNLLLHDDPGDQFSGGSTYVLTGEAAPTKEDKVNGSAWKWLEYGTSKMAAQAPGRKALGQAEIE